jgi:cytochrome c-type biogenesis protein CcmH/NrfG
MRLLPRALMIGLAVTLVASPVVSQKPDDQLNLKSVELMHQGEALLAAGKFNEAEDALETALVVDPRNRFAFVDLARVATKQKLFGKAIRLTNKALMLEPNDRDAIAVQGEAMVELGAVQRAKDNLAKLQKLCPDGCQQVASLTSAITRGPTVASAKVPEVPKKN